jgi:hypothetical protein
VRRPRPAGATFSHISLNRSSASTGNAASIAAACIAAVRASAKPSAPIMRRGGQEQRADFRGHFRGGTIFKRVQIERRPETDSPFIDG